MSQLIYLNQNPNTMYTLHAVVIAPNFFFFFQSDLPLFLLIFLRSLTYGRYWFSCPIQCPICWICLFAWASLVAQMVKNLPAMQETWVQSLGREDPPEKKMATHSSILAWRIPWTEESGGLWSMGLQKSQTQINNYHTSYWCHLTHSFIICPISRK